MTTSHEQAALVAVRHHYPEANATGEGVDQLLDLLATDYGLAPKQVLFADSICSDDVNSIQYPPRAHQMLGPFRLGGLDGFPHAGLTGMGAFAGHVPDCGAVLIYHAPHIGVTRDGTLGVIMRTGQSKPSGCCGAARAALARLQAGTIIIAPPSDLDYQQETIEQLFLQQSSRILGAAAPLKEATEVMYEAIADRIDALISRTTISAPLIIRYGSVLINGDADMGSFNATRRILITNTANGQVRDLLAE